MNLNNVKHLALLLLKIVGALILLGFIILGFLWLATPDVSGFRG